MKLLSSSNLILHSLVMFALAVLCFVQPKLASFSIALVPGLVLVAGGVLVFLFGRDRSTGSNGIWNIVLAVFMAAAGLAIIIWPSILIVLIGLVLLAEGIDKVVVALRLRKLGLDCWSWMFLPSALAIVAGFVAVFATSVATSLVGIVAGVGFLASAVGCVLAYLWAGKA
ncbi:MAG: DUF308 domain-containing protein [Bacteroidales bacterium]|nr:DUF308 domain-containing protein [Bacteroidales bacterium]